MVSLSETSFAKCKNLATIELQLASTECIEFDIGRVLFPIAAQLYRVVIKKCVFDIESMIKFIEKATRLELFAVAFLQHKKLD